MRVLILLVLGGIALGQGVTWSGVDAALTKLVTGAGESGLEVGCCVIDPGTGERLYAVQAERLMIPASNQKVFTAAAALLGFGPEHRICTDLVAHGAIGDGVLKGDLRLRGEGDPTLESARVLPWLLERVRAAGIRHVEGALLIDERFFAHELRGPEWPDEEPSKAWMAAVSPLSLDHGTAAVRLLAGAGPGAAARCRIVPQGAAPFACSAVTARSNSEHLIGVSREAGSEMLRVSGRVAPLAAVHDVAVAVLDPAQSFGNALLAALEQGGVRVDGGTRRAAADAPRGGLLLARLRTRVADVLPVLMKSSQNHRAEMLARHLAAAQATGAGFADAGRAMTAILEGAGARLGGSVLADGSGLSRANRTTARALAEVLGVVWRSPQRAAMLAVMPTAGEDDSTLDGRLKDLGARVHAKTGTLRAVSTLSGFVNTAAGRTLAFSILVQQARPSRRSAREVQDGIVRALARFGGTP